ncbi:MAG TPA: class I SAM-dependent methyltransferase [Gammaproteobacteria bacterium]|nr:class I SAM-dependent methyltransferase [Gammaproteobacteria bacterium]HIL96867.1 class I SAM-dependent methyltransferase [Pseudomonadales bacterium]
MSKSDKTFAGSIPEIYNNYLVPLIFESYAADLAQRVSEGSCSQVLEIATGTGVVARALIDKLGNSVTIIATDLNQPMLDKAASIRVDDNVSWHQADAVSLPFEDGSFDVVVCQFSVMFFPDRVKAYAEAKRVLKPGGRFLFSAWDDIKENEFSDTVTNALAVVFPDNPPRFLARTPHGYFDIEKIKSDVAEAGFSDVPRVDTISARSKASDPSIPAIAYCQGTPLRSEIEAIDSSLLDQATEAVTQAISARFGSGAVDGKIQALVVTCTA